MEIESKTFLENYIQEDLQKIEGLYLPEKANFLEQILVKKLPPRKIHPNPRDEFCSDETGPSYSIVEKYVRQITKNREYEVPIFDEPVIVEKMRPDGYMLLNGHHRWAAALILDLKTIPVKLINVTHAADIISDLQKTSRVKRASINLDDVVFCRNASEPSEKPLFFPFNKIFPERIRLGIPALFFALHEEGYDIWIYTSGYASTDYIDQLFRHYHIQIDGIVNGSTRLKAGDKAGMRQAAALLEKKYSTTLHIDTESVLQVRSGTKEFRQADIDAQGEKWAGRVISIVKSFEKSNL